MFFFFYFKNDCIADKKCEQLEEVMELIEFEGVDVLSLYRTIELSCDILLACVSKTQDWDNGHSALSSINYIVKEKLLSSQAIEALKKVKSLRHKTVHSESNNKQLADLLDGKTKVQTIFLEISSVLRLDAIGVSDNEHAHGYADRIEWIGQQICDKLQEIDKPATTRNQVSIQDCEISEENTNNKYVFISYSTRHQQEADSFRQLLISKGIKVWMAPYDIAPGAEYASVLLTAIKHCACCVLLLTQAAQDSFWVAKEIERVNNYHKIIIPVKLEEVELNDFYEFHLAGDQIIAVREVKEDTIEMQQVLHSIRTIIQDSSLNA